LISALWTLDYHHFLFSVQLIPTPPPINDQRIAFNNKYTEMLKCSERPISFYTFLSFYFCRFLLNLLFVFFYFQYFFSQLFFLILFYLITHPFCLLT